MRQRQSCFHDNQFNDPLLDRVRMRSECERREQERRDAFWNGAQHNGGMIALIVGGVLYFLFAVVSSLYEEIRETIQQRRRRKLKKKRSNAVKVHFHEV